MASGVSDKPSSLSFLIFFFPFFRSCLWPINAVFGICIRTERCYIVAPFIAYMVSCVALEPCGVGRTMY